MTEGGVKKIKYVQRVTYNGAEYMYFRKGNYREGPLNSPEGSEELQAEVAAILARLKGRAALTTPKPNTLAPILTAYNKSADFLSLARATQESYQGYIDELVEDCGNVLLAEVTRSWLVEMRDAWALRGHRVAAHLMQMLKNALEPIISDDTDNRVKGDPFHKLKKVRRPADLGEAHLTWTDDEVWAFIDDAIKRNTPGLARAAALGRFAGYRRGTICKIPIGARIVTQNVNGEPERRLYWVTEKRKVLSDKREDPRLDEVMRRTASNAWYIAYNADGGQWKPRQLNQAFDRNLARLAKAGKVRAAFDEDGVIYCPLDIHGLRHARGVELAEAGASDAEIMTQLEHSTPRSAATYRAQAQRRKMADAAQDRVDNVVNLAKARTQVKQKL
jgi:hypothetical protein